MIAWRQSRHRFDASIGIFTAAVCRWQGGWACSFEGVTASKIFRTVDEAKRAAEDLARAKLREAMGALAAVPAADGS